MRTMLVAAGLAIALGAPPALAQNSLTPLDYFETNSTRTLGEAETQVQHGLDTGTDRLGALANQLAFMHGLTDRLMVAAALQTGGDGAFSLAVPSYVVGFQFAPDAAVIGWTPAIQLQYQGGFNPAAQARGVLSFDALAPSLFGGQLERFNLSANLVAEQRFEGAAPPLVAYRLGASYPLLASSESLALAGGQTADFRTWVDPRLRMTVELLGDLTAGGSHYVMPGLFTHVGESVGLGLGVGLRLTGADRPLFLQTQFELGF